MSNLFLLFDSTYTFLLFHSALKWDNCGFRPSMTVSWEITVLIPEAEVAHIREMVLAEFMNPYHHQLTIRVAAGIY